MDVESEITTLKKQIEENNVKIAELKNQLLSVDDSNDKLELNENIKVMQEKINQLNEELNSIVDKVILNELLIKELEININDNKLQIDDLENSKNDQMSENELIDVANKIKALIVINSEKQIEINEL